MSEMVERIARVLQDADDAFTAKEALDPAYVALARTAIKAMREPTDVMVLSGTKAAVDQHYYKKNAWERCVPEEAQQDWLYGSRYGYQAMILEALEE